MEDKEKQNQIDFGKRIQHLRKERKWSQEELASRANCHRTYIGLIERAEREPGLNKIIYLAHAFEITIAELFNYENNKELTK
ncbi:MAG: helix-turn-helix domain-containing protein [Flavobacteriaceae bacterium]|jgi:transcriptional regulator with XRE-family HTH domain|nr:helix-turn-helix domain-containing protein [Flavobacteriaceae bacterium]